MIEDELQNNGDIRSKKICEMIDAELWKKVKKLIWNYLLWLYMRYITYVSADLEDRKLLQTSRWGLGSTNCVDTCWGSMRSSRVLPQPACRSSFCQYQHQWRSTGNLDTLGTLSSGSQNCTLRVMIHRRSFENCYSQRRAWGISGWSWCIQRWGRVLIQCHAPWRGRGVCWVKWLSLQQGVFFLRFRSSYWTFSWFHRIFSEFTVGHF